MSKRPSGFGLLFGVEESSQSLMSDAQILFRQAQAGNQLAINEIEQGLKLESKWRYTGIISKQGGGTYHIRNPDEPLTSSGPMPLAGTVLKHPLSD